MFETLVMDSTPRSDRVDAQIIPKSSRNASFFGDDWQHCRGIGVRQQTPHSRILSRGTEKWDYTLALSSASIFNKFERDRDYFCKL
jgi:hypothetical protein